MAILDLEVSRQPIPEYYRHDFAQMSLDAAAAASTLAAPCAAGSSKAQQLPLPPQIAAGGATAHRVSAVSSRSRAATHETPATRRRGGYGGIVARQGGPDTQTGAKPSKSCRLRFFNFNMANSSSYQSVAELQGPGGRGRFEQHFSETLADGSNADIVFITLVETRLPVTEWVQDYTAKRKRASHLDVVLSQNARRESAQVKKSPFGALAENLACTYNGNLKTILAFSSKTFREEPNGALFGLFHEARVAGLHLPNPKKSFLGQMVETTDGEGESLRLAFVGAHFPISKVANALEDPNINNLQKAKIALGKTLRKVLEAASNELSDGRTLLFVQGDLNSRTELGGGMARDVLLEILNDESMQLAIQEGLPLPLGEWQELPCYESAYDLPVTYKYQESGGRADLLHTNLTIGDIMDAAVDGNDRSQTFCFGPGDDGVQRSMSQRPCELYHKAMYDIGDKKLADWGLAFKSRDFKAFRFPACADRVVYWAPLKLSRRIHWELPRGGYEMNLAQLGSDHRPVSLEVVMHLYPPPTGVPPEDMTGGHEGRRLTTPGIRVDSGIVVPIDLKSQATVSDEASDSVADSQSPRHDRLRAAAVPS
eukprot:TRINITY_DN7388_c0_g1_i3.p1 TRINITY_DN7388_c0_g1~~TRINITY_DN7388_c0_g1_i3.p1  ORF type:complete len:597 (-),score=94.83 TRINITY_DN7388_c0_g1_i3:286-2076(-)